MVERKAKKDEERWEPLDAVLCSLDSCVIGTCCRSFVSEPPRQGWSTLT